MTLDIVDALKQGLDRTFTRSGAIIASLFFATTILTMVGTQSLFKAMGVYASAAQAPPAPFAMGGPAALHGALLILGSLASAVVSVAAIRTFTSKETESVPKEFFTRNIGWVLLNTVVGGIVFGLVVGAPLVASVGAGIVLSSFASLLGLLIGVILGIAGVAAVIFLAVSLLFWNIHVAKQDTGFVEAFQESWNMTKGNRIKVFALWIAIGAISFVAGFVSGFVTGFIPVTAVSSLVSLVVSAAAAAFGVATLSQAYNQLL